MAYSPTMGRWIEQDPLGYIDGMNDYGFGNDNPISRTDPLGLAWDIERKGGARADASGECGDTVEDLARKSNLSATDYKKWLVATDGKALPASAKEQLTENRKFTIPNTVYVDVGEYGTGLLFFNSYGVATGYQSGFQSQGFKVVYTHPASEADLLGHLGSSDIEGIVYVGHGTDDGFLLTNKSKNPKGTWAGTLVNAIDHKLGFAIFRACYFGVANDTLSALVSENGYLSTTTDGIYVWTDAPQPNPH